MHSIGKKVIVQFGYDSKSSILHPFEDIIIVASPFIDAYWYLRTIKLLMEKFGVCQDHVHIFLSCIRQLGFPGRYVSGYLMLDDTNIQDASHAWAEVYIEHLGWVGFDISNSISPDNRYVKLAVGFDYSDVIPISGIRVGDSDEKINTKIIIETKQ